MANKQQVLALLEQGLTPKQIAKKLKCSDAYVRATRRRETKDGREKARQWRRNEYVRMTSTPEGRLAYNEYHRSYYRGEKARMPKAGVHYPTSR